VSFVLLKVIDLVVGLRVSEESETEGLDIAEHGEAAYNA
jgi:Amt family ammonium transporter